MTERAEIYEFLEAKERDHTAVVSWIHRGDYEPPQLYARGDVVRMRGASYVAVSDCPGDCPTDGWQLVAEVGEKGEKGSRGEQGYTGKQGMAGPPGEMGPPGRSIRWRGRYAPFTQYTRDDVVYFDDALWIALQDTEELPKADQINWDLMIRLRGGGGGGGGTSVECPMHMIAPYTPHMDVTCGAVAQDNGWLMHANKSTADRAAPQFTSEEAWGVFGDSTPTWVDMTTGTTRLITGVRIRPTNFLQVRSVRVWIPYVDPDIRYSVLVTSQNETNVPLYVDIFPVETGWHLISDPAVSGLVGGGDTVDVFLVTQGQGSSATTFTGTWDFRAIGANPAPTNGPDTYKFWYYETNAPDTAYWSVIDQDDVDRTADIATMKAGDQLEVAYTNPDNDPPGKAAWTLTETPVWYPDSSTGGTKSAFFDLSVSPAVDIPDNERNWRDFTATVYLDRPMDYVRVIDQFAGDPVLAGLYAEGGASEVSETDDAYGVDVLYRLVGKSEDWDFMAYSG